MRLIDADELLTAFPIDDEPMLTKSCVKSTIQHMPTIEAEPVTHCKDCLFGHRYWDVINGYEDTWIECRNPDGLYRDVSIDGYCSGGTKK